MRIGVGEWIVAVKLEENGATMRVRSYELGYREIGEITRHRLGIVIPIRWWYERPRGSDVWYERTHRAVVEEFEAVCVPVIPTYLPRSRTRRDRIILWTTTQIEGVSGVNNISVLQEASARSSLRYSSTLATGEPIEVATACTECGRHRGERWCQVCGRWHHTNCVPGNCSIPIGSGTLLDVKQTASMQYAWCEGDRNLSVQAGDGSVLEANSTGTKGSWAFQIPTGYTVMGQLRIHRPDITSTRCEVHALLAGLQLYGDDGIQICDNKSAISIFERARAISQGREQDVKYRDIHRTELRSLSKAMRPDGTMKVVWVQSHREGEFTSDTQLRKRRQALACVDRAALECHQREMMASYASWIVFDKVMIVDEEGALVLGNTLRYLTKRVHGDQRRRYMLKQAQKGEARHVLTEDEIEMITKDKWTDSLRHFYWRARANILHTNAVKHRFDERWPEECTICVDEAIDTQDHRFGLDDTGCRDLAKLTQRLNATFGKIDSNSWLPDQHILLPGIAHSIGVDAGLEAREAWTPAAQTRHSWRIMVPVGSLLWANAQWLDWLGDVAQLCCDTRFITLLENEIVPIVRRKWRCMIPVYLVEVVRQLHPVVGFYAAFLPQWTPGWAAATFHHRFAYDQFPGLAHLNAPTEVHVWWLDDVYQPHSEEWWRCWQRLYESRLMSSSPVFWVATSFGSEGHRWIEHIGCRWIIKIPAGALRMRTESSVVQRHPHDRRSVVQHNAVALLIGVIAQGSEVERIANRSIPYWRHSLQLYYTDEWLMNEWTTVGSGDDVADTCHPVLDWYNQNSDSMLQPSWWAQLRQQLDRLGLAVYDAPKGWTRYPTMTRGSLEWAHIVSYTASQTKSLHATYFYSVWLALREHWKFTCTRDAADVDYRDCNVLLADVNQGIQSRRQNWTRRSQTKVSHRLQERRQWIHERGRRWLADRQQHLDRPSQGSA